MRTEIALSACQTSSHDDHKILITTAPPHVNDCNNSESNLNKITIMLVVRWIMPRAYLQLPVTKISTVFILSRSHHADDKEI